MVSYQTFVELAFDVAENRNMRFDGIEDGGQFMSQLGAHWRENKQEIKQMTRAQARSHLEGVVTA